MSTTFLLLVGVFHLCKCRKDISLVPRPSVLGVSLCVWERDYGSHLRKIINSHDHWSVEDVYCDTVNI